MSKKSKKAGKSKNTLVVDPSHKDVLFRFIFKNKERLLNLYNAINNSSYTDPEALEVNTLENVVYISMKNDISFIIESTLNLYEHQSSINPNMPVRGLMYFSQIFKGILANENLYGTVLIKLPTPSYIVFYNGEQDIKDKTRLKLSDAFEIKTDEPCLECTATMININFGHNKELLEKCKPLFGYSEFIYKIRQYQDDYSKETAVNMALDYCIKNKNPIADILKIHRAEVTDMLLTEYYDEKKIKKLFREEGRKEGLQEGLQKGVLLVAVNLYKAGLDLTTISNCTGLDLDTLSRHDIK